MVCETLHVYAMYRIDPSLEGTNRLKRPWEPRETKEVLIGEARDTINTSEVSQGSQGRLSRLVSSREGSIWLRPYR